MEPQGVPPIAGLAAERRSKRLERPVGVPPSEPPKPGLNTAEVKGNVQSEGNHAAGLEALQGK